ncbi:NfeD family protein [Flavobacterium hercynium]|uniref:DUF4190 domain-containing protein n=1 Tax=Flavobacterium hercynium TaxID=387094 RepID=A0A226GWI6_9FLAO|nr:DUF4190 domain-containing protein [Flavobacterium hercynium]OXA86419.1 hypothetical protein B0A66_18260 [Flavobacterium hercynium]SMP17194.1 hypothetical protein SAMN06265346_105108 [Flavobacterium hercynium]
MENNLQQSSAGQGMGIAALVLGVLAAIAAFIPCFGLIAIFFGVLAIIFGAIGLSQAKNGNASTTMPKAGLILGIVSTAFVIIWMLVVVGSFGSAIMSQKDELTKSLDSVNAESAKSLDSLDVEVVTDTVQ